MLYLSWWGWGTTEELSTNRIPAPICLFVSCFRNSGHLNPVQIKLASIWRESKKKANKGQRVQISLGQDGLWWFYCSCSPAVVQLWINLLETRSNRNQLCFIILDCLMSHRAVNDNKSVLVCPPEATLFPAGSSVVRIIRSLEKNVQSRTKLVVSPEKTWGL